MHFDSLSWNLPFPPTSGLSPYQRSRKQTQTMPLQWHRPETPVCFVRTSKETRAVSKINRLALITMFAKHGPSLVRQGATRSYNHLCLWIFCRICINTAVRQRHIHPITIKLICQNTVPLRQQPIFKGLNFFAKALHCADAKHQVRSCTCASVCMRVCTCATHWGEGCAYFTGTPKIDGGWMVLQMSINI